MPQIPELLTALTEELAQIRDAGNGALSLESIRLEPTADEDFLYVEAELGCQAATEIDISIHESRAFIRIERPLEGASSGVELEAELRSVFGWVEFAEGGAWLRAVLYTDSMWTCTAAPAIALFLNRDFSPAGDISDDGWGCDVLIRAAERLHGLAWLGSGRLPPD
jgi:hypothetical protein